MIGVMPQANNETSGYNTVIQYIFTNDFFLVGNVRFYYPMLGQFFGTLVAFVVSHLIYATVYNAINTLTVDYLAMGLGSFIAFIVDRIIFTVLLFLQNLIEGVNTFDFFLKCLTSEFIGYIAAALVVIVLYIIITSIVDARKKHQFS